MLSRGNDDYYQITMASSAGNMILIVIASIMLQFTYSQNVCPPGMIFEICGSGCGPASCDNLPSATQACLAVCIQDCFCPPGLVKDRSDGDRCISPEECSDVCPPGMNFEMCGSGCGPASCDNLPSATQGCADVCIRDCFCPPGLVKDRSDGDRCITPEECSDVCPPGMIFEMCGSGCGPASCDNLPSATQVCAAVCIRDCFCPEGLVKDRSDGDRCISPEECSATYDLRLAGTGTTSYQGRVEIYYNGEWGTICGSGFSYSAARVVCLQLGFSGHSQYYTSPAKYGEGSGPVWLRISGCTGQEEAIHDCKSTSYDWGQTSCSSSYSHAAVDCNPTSYLFQNTIRLVGPGSSSSQGRVEINYQGRWGTVCNNSWSSTDAAVVCKQLGFTGSASTGSFGRGYGVIWMDNVGCNTNDDSLASCSHNGWGNHTCNHNIDAGVVCTKSYDIDEYSVRLAGIGSSYREGRVEIFYNGRWGSVCDDQFYLNAARVVCRQLGFSGILSYHTGAYYGSGSGVIWLGDVRCSGEEDNLALCVHNGFGNHNCHHTEDVGVSCDAAAGTTKESNLRLVGQSSSEGLIEINHDGQWGTICDVGWGLNDATVACRQLGFSRALGAPGGGQFGHVGRGRGRVWMHSVACTGNEAKLASCAHSGWGNTGDCTHKNDAGVICSTEREHDDYTIRLSGAGRLLNAGRVEIYYNGQWGTICDNSWDINDALVVCRRLGFANATDAPHGARYGEASGSVWIGGVACSGSEKSLETCGHDGFGGIECDHSRDASVICSLNRNEHDFVVRLAGTGSSESEGRVEISYDGQWGTICSNRWDLDDASVVCKQLGFLEAEEIRDASTYGEGSGPIWLDGLECSGTEATLNECNHNGWGVNDCEHSHDAGVVCKTTASTFSYLGPGGVAGISVAFGIVAVVIVILVFVIWKLKKSLAEMKLRTAEMALNTVPQRVVHAQDGYEDLNLPRVYESMKF